MTFFLLDPIVIVVFPRPFFIVMAILKSTSMFLRKISPNDTSSLGTGPPRRNKAPEPRRAPLQKWSLPNFGTLSSQRSSKYRYTGLAQGSENQPLIRHLGLQEEPGAISNNSSLVNAPDSPILEDDTPQGNARSILHMPLIPLAIAQRRQEIQRRIAEFASSGDAPFAIHPNGLLPLAEAITRNDIRRRKEGFELLEEKKPRRDLAIYKTSENTDGSMAPLLPDRPTSDVASESADVSVYSVSSYGDPGSQVISSFDHISAFD